MDIQIGNGYEVMPAEIGWLVTERIFYSRSWGDIDLEIVKQHADIILEFLNSGQTTDVYVIFDSLEVETFDIELQKLNLQTRRYLTHKRVVCSIDITNSTRNQVMGHVVSGVAKVNWRYVCTRQEALDYIMLMDDGFKALDMSLFDLFVPLRTID